MSRSYECTQSKGNDTDRCFVAPTTLPNANDLRRPKRFVILNILGRANKDGYLLCTSNFMVFGPRIILFSGHSLGVVPAFATIQFPVIIIPPFSLSASRAIYFFFFPLDVVGVVAVVVASLVHIFSNGYLFLLDIRLYLIKITQIFDTSH